MRQKPNFDRRNDDCDEIIRYISLITKISTQIKRKNEVDFMTIKIRSPTNGYCLNQN